MKKVITNSQNLANSAAMPATQFTTNDIALTNKQMTSVKGGGIIEDLIAYKQGK